MKVSTGASYIPATDNFFTKIQSVLKLRKILLSNKQSCDKVFIFHWLQCRFTVSTLRLVQFVWVVEGINSASANAQNALIKELKSLSCWKLSRRCTSMSNWYNASGWCCLFPPCILLWNHWYCLLASSSETTHSASGTGPTCSLFCRFLASCLQRLARWKLALDSYSFTRCWNVSLLRLRTLALLGARQHR